MAKVCRGGQFDGYKLTTPRDEQLCRQGGGEVVETSDTGGGTSQAGVCSATTISTSALPGPRHSSVLAEAALTPLRLVRDEVPQSALVRELETLNQIGAAEIERLIHEDPAIGEDLSAALAWGIGFAAAMLAAERGRHQVRYTPELHASFAHLAHAIRDRTRNEDLRRGLDRLVPMAEPLVGRTAQEVRASLR